MQALKQKREHSILTAQNLKDFLSNQGIVKYYESNGLQIDSDAQGWLRSNLNIDIEALRSKKI